MKQILYFVLLPFFVPFMLFFYIVHNWKDGESWFEKQLESTNPLRWALFAVTSLVIFPLMLVMNLAFDAWSKLNDD